MMMMIRAATTTSRKRFVSRRLAAVATSSYRSCRCGLCPFVSLNNSESCCCRICTTTTTRNKTKTPSIHILSNSSLTFPTNPSPYVFQSSLTRQPQQWTARRSFTSSTTTTTQTVPLIATLALGDPNDINTTSRPSPQATLSEGTDDGISSSSFTAPASSTLSLYKQAHRTLDEIEQCLVMTNHVPDSTSVQPSDNTSSSITPLVPQPQQRKQILLQPEQWMEAEDVLWNLSNIRTLESVDLTFILLDKLLLARQQQRAATNNKHHQDLVLVDEDAYSKFLLNWELWHSILINWQQVSKEHIQNVHLSNSKTRRTQHRSSNHLDDESSLVSPRKLFVMLNGWNAIVASSSPLSSTAAPVAGTGSTAAPQRQHSFTCITAKTLSLLIDVTGRRGAYMADSSYHDTVVTPKHEIRKEAEFAEQLLFRMMDRVAAVDSSTNSFPPSTSNLNMVLSLWSKVGNGDRAWSLLRQCCCSAPPHSSSVSHDTTSHHHHHRRPTIQPNLFSYNAIIQAYAVSGNGIAAEKVVAELLHKADHVTNSTTSTGTQIDNDDNVIRPDVTTWNIVLGAWARSQDKVMAAQRVEQLLCQMMMCGNEESGGDAAAGFESKREKDAYFNGNSQRSGLFARKATKSTLPSALDNVPVNVKPNLTTFNTALSAWARAGEAEMCAQLLDEMHHWHRTRRLDDPPDAVSYSTVMNAFAKAGQPDKAEALSNEMYTAFTERGMNELRPSIPILTMILDAYARQIGDATFKKDYTLALHSVQRAQKVFQRMRDLNQFGFLDSGPDTTAYNVMLTCYLRSCPANTFPRVNTSAELADGLLQEMKQMAARHDMRSAPDFKSYSIVIQAWLLRPDGVGRAIELLDELWDAQGGTGHKNPRMKPDSMSLHCIVVAFSRVNKPDVAHQLLMRVLDARQHDVSCMVEPKLASFGSVMGALSRSKHSQAAQIALDMVTRVENLHKQGIISQAPDQPMYRTLVSLWSYSDHIRGSARKALSILLDMRRRALRDNDVGPELTSYNQVLFAFSRGTSDPVRAEQLLRLMYEDCKRRGNSVQPDIKSFNSVLTAWARCDHPSAVDRADALFQEIQQLHHRGEVKCDAVTYNIMLNCLAKSSKIESAEHAEKLICKMKELTDAGNTTFQPNSISYGCLLSAWLRANDVARAADVMTEMCDAFKGGALHMKPQLRHFEQVIHAISSSHDEILKERLPTLLEARDFIHTESIDEAHHVFGT